MISSITVTIEAGSHDHGVYSISCFCTIGHLIGSLTVELELFLVCVKCFYRGEIPGIGALPWEIEKKLMFSVK